MDESLALRGVASPQGYSTYSDLQDTGQNNSISVNETNVSTDLAGIIAQKQVLKAVHTIESDKYQTAAVYELPLCSSEVSSLSTMCSLCRLNISVTLITV